MSNRMDFFQAEQRQLALPAASVSMLVNGILCPDLDLVEIVRSGWPEFGWAKLAYNPAANISADVKAAENVENEFPAGKTICIRQYYNSDLCGSTTLGLPIFNGQIDSIETIRTPDGEKVEIVERFQRES